MKAAKKDAKARKSPATSPSRGHRDDGHKENLVDDYDEGEVKAGAEKTGMVYALIDEEDSAGNILLGDRPCAPLPEGYYFEVKVEKSTVSALEANKKSVPDADGIVLGFTTLSPETTRDLPDFADAMEP